MAAPELRGGYIRVDASGEAPPPAGAGGILFLNRCDGGCAVTPGNDSSLADTSSIVSQGIGLSAWNRGDAAWFELVACVRGIFEPFNIAVTDTDPGATPHHEVMIAGTFAEFGLVDPALGVAPLSCNFQPNSLTFVFGNEPASIFSVCHATAQEPGHAWGLDHELLCEDPMTYLSGCGPKGAFQDVDAECGEFTARPCECGGLTQNSFQTIAQIFGTRASVGPEVTITEPADGATVEIGFAIRATAVDDAQIATIDVRANGTPILEQSGGADLAFDAPTGLQDRDVELEVIATNVHGASGTATVSIRLEGGGGNGQDVDDNGGGGLGPPREGCGCDGSGTSGAPWAAVLLVYLLWRLRNSASTSDT